MADRKLISWRIDRLDEHEQSLINGWLDKQQNIQTSITNVILHTIEQFGQTDIMSYDNQKILYAKIMAVPVVQVEPVSQVITETVEVPKKEVIEKTEDPDDIYGKLRPEDM